MLRKMCVGVLLLMSVESAAENEGLVSKARIALFRQQRPVQVPVLMPHVQQQVLIPQNQISVPEISSPEIVASNKEIARLEAKIKKTEKAYYNADGSTNWLPVFNVVWNKIIVCIRAFVSKGPR